MPTNIGFNVRGGRVQTAMVLRDVDRLNCGWILVESEPHQANEIAQMRPDLTVVYRDYWPPSTGDDNLHRQVTPEQYIDRMLSLDLAPDILWHVNNEPTEYSSLTPWLLETLDRADRIGRRLVVGNFSTGTPEPNYWRSTLASLLERLSGTWHVLGLHEYINGDLDRSDPWFIGRYQFVLDACSARDIEPPLMAITEHGYDLVGSWQSLGLSAEEFAYSLQHTCGRYAVHNIPALLFSYGAWGDTWEFDVLPAMDALAARQWPTLTLPEKPLVPPDEVWSPGVAVPTDGGVNVRPHPHTERPPLATIRQPTLCEYIDSGETWWRIRYGSVNGWIHSAYVRFEGAQLPEPQPAPVPDVECADLVEQVARLESENTTLRQEIRALQIKLGQIASILNE